MRFADDSHHNRTLLDCLLRVLYLEDAALGGAVCRSQQRSASLAMFTTTHNVTESLS